MRTKESLEFLAVRHDNNEAEIIDENGEMRSGRDAYRAESCSHRLDLYGPPVTR